MNQNKQSLQADPLSLVLGIISLVLGITGCCCYGIPTIVTLILAIIGLIAANRSIRSYEANPEAYSLQTRNNVGTAKVINIIAVIFNGVIVLLVLIVFVLYGTLMSTAVLEGMRNGDFNQEKYDYGDYDWQNDTINVYEEDDYIVREQIDTVKVDSLIIE